MRVTSPQIKGSTPSHFYTGRKSLRGASIPPALASAALLLAFGAAGWWFLKGPAYQRVPQEPEPETAEAPAPPAALTDLPPAPSAPGAPKTEPKKSAKTENGVLAQPVPALVEAPAINPFAKLLVLDALGTAKSENVAWHGEAWQLALTTGLWDDYRDLLARSLQAFAGSDKDTATIMAGKFSGPALTRHAFLSAVPVKVLHSLLDAEGSHPFMEWLLGNPDAMQAFIVQLSPQDDIEGALQVWNKIAAGHPKARTEYRELAIACSLVFDRSISYGEARYGDHVEVLSRYSHFEEKSEAGRLEGKIKKMTAADLVWVVGVPVSNAELEWAVKKAGFRQKTWGQAYGTIKYDMEKAVSGKNSYSEYTFAEIQKKGGICSDQSYFTAWTACATGIPAAIITGDGERGPHAWITWMADEGEWKFSGRFGGYPAGQCECPQTGENISEEEFGRMGDRKAASAEQRIKAKQALWMAAVYHKTPARAMGYITEAVKIAPRLADASTAMLGHWMQHRATAEVEEWAALLKDLRKNFRDSAALMEIAAQAEQKFVFARQETAVTIKDLKREARKMDETAGAKKGIAADLERLTGGLRRQAEVLFSNQDEEGVRSMYRKALADYGNDAATFKALAQDYFAFFQADEVRAVKACHELESTCRRSVGRGKGDWFDVLSQNSAWRLVASFYRKAGDEKKASLIERDCDSREKAAKQKAI